MLKDLKWELSKFVYQLTELKLDQGRHLLLLKNDPQNSILLENLQDINNKYKDVKRKWKILWIKQQEKKMNWLSYGDDDLNYLYLSIKKEALTLLEKFTSMMRLSMNPLIGDSLCIYFSSLFNAPKPYFNNIYHLSCGKGLTKDQFIEIGSLFNDNKIFQELKDIGEDKSHGIDGFTSKFFTYTWELLGNQFAAIVKSFSTLFKISNNFKHTLITLISKSKNATLINDYRPISGYFKSSNGLI